VVRLREGGGDEVMQDGARKCEAMQGGVRKSTYPIQHIVYSNSLSARSAQNN
jgi:hypothetical protein